MSTFPSAFWLALTACACASVPAAACLLQKLCRSTPTWIKELKSLGQPRKHKLPGTAIICGGSIAGIVAARICADHFERVVVIDPEIHDSERPKTRIMQYNAAHAFLSYFVDGARRLWPHFDAEVMAAGGRTAPADTQLHYAGVLLPTPWEDYPTGQFPDTLVIRRSMAQTVLHRILLKDSQSSASTISLLPGTVRGVKVSGEVNSIESVDVRQSDGTITSLSDVALVVDCTGAAQGGLKWLKTAGFSLPDDIRYTYDGNLCYLSLCFTVPADLMDVLPIPERLRNTMAMYAYASHVDVVSCLVGLVMTDNNTIQLVIGNTVYEDLPRSSADVPSFLAEFADAHTPAWVVDLVRILCEKAAPTFDIIRLAPQSYVRYESAPAGALPSNFVAVGDAAVRLNPVHAQGFAKVMLNGVAMNSLLHAIKPDGIPNGLPADFSMRYFKKCAGWMDGLWDSTRLHDYGSPTCEPMKGETRDTGRLARWFESKLVSAAAKEPEVASALWHVRHLLATDKAFLAPTVLWKVLRTPSMFK